MLKIKYYLINKLYKKLTLKRNRIVHSFQITNENEQIILSTKTYSPENIQFHIDENYLLNFIYSLLICFITLIPSLFITYYTNKIITPLLLLITFGSFLGLHFSKAKNDKFSYFITLLVSFNFIILFNLFAFNHLSNSIELDFANYFNQNTWYVIRKILFSILFIFGGMRFYKMFLAKYHPNFDEIIKNI